MYLSALTAMWIFIGLFLTLFGIFVFICHRKRSLNQEYQMLVLDFEHYKYVSASFDNAWFENLLKKEECDTVTNKKYLATWHQNEEFWAKQLHDLKQALVKNNFKRAVVLRNNITQCRTACWESFKLCKTTMNDLIKRFQKDSLKTKLLLFNQILEEFYNYVTNESNKDGYELTDNMIMLKKFRKYISTKFNDQTTVMNEEMIDLILSYSRILLNYHQFILSINKWNIVYDELLKSDNWALTQQSLSKTELFALQSQRGKLEHLASKFKVQNKRLCDGWFVINDFQKDLVKVWQTKYLLEWKKNNASFIKKVAETFKSIESFLGWFKEQIAPNQQLVWIHNLARNWIRDSQFLIENSRRLLTENRLNSLEDDRYSLELWPPAALKALIQLCEQLLVWSTQTNILINTLNEFNFIQEIAQFKKLQLLNEIEFLDREYTPNREELYCAQEVLNQIQAPYNLANEQVMNVSAITVNMFLDHNYKQQTYEIIARELWKQINVDQYYEIFTETEWKQLDHAYNNIEYKKFIEQTVRILIKLKVI